MFSVSLLPPSGQTAALVENEVSDHIQALFYPTGKAGKCEISTSLKQ